MHSQLCKCQWHYWKLQCIVSIAWWKPLQKLMWIVNTIYDFPTFFFWKLVCRISGKIFDIRKGFLWSVLNFPCQRNIKYNRITYAVCILRNRHIIIVTISLINSTGKKFEPREMEENVKKIASNHSIILSPFPYKHFWR